MAVDDLDGQGERTHMSLWDLVQAYRDDTGASEAWIMRRAGLNKGTFSAWRTRGVPSLPYHDQLVALSDVLRVDYTTLLEAVLHDTSYLPERAARRQAEFTTKSRDEFWLEVRSLAEEALFAMRGDKEKARRRILFNEGREAPNDVRHAALQVVAGQVPNGAPDWLSEAIDTPDLKAAAKEGVIEESGENNI